jgi:hypothetical protein
MSATSLSEMAVHLAVCLAAGPGGMGGTDKLAG